MQTAPRLAEVAQVQVLLDTLRSALYTDLSSCSGARRRHADVYLWKFVWLEFTCKILSSSQASDEFLVLQWLG